METKVAGNKKVHLPNHLGIKGWAWAGRYTWERYLYTLHRLTGLGMLFFITIHLGVNGIRLGGEDHWIDAMDFLGNPVFKVGEYFVVAAFIFHTLNGGRLILQHLAYTLGKPKPPIYPYVDALRGKRAFMWMVLLATVIIAIYVAVAFIIGD
jgi:succinate dehydrogenase / fumarate reductase cytochrome b subunit